MGFYVNVYIPLAAIMVFIFFIGLFELYKIDFKNKRDTKGHKIIHISLLLQFVLALTLVILIIRQMIFGDKWNAIFASPFIILSLILALGSTMAWLENHFGPPRLRELIIIPCAWAFIYIALPYLFDIHIL